MFPFYLCVSFPSLYYFVVIATKESVEDNLSGKNRRPCSTLCYIWVGVETRLRVIVLVGNDLISNRKTNSEVHILTHIPALQRLSSYINANSVIRMMSLGRSRLGLVSGVFSFYIQRLRHKLKHDSILGRITNARHDSGFCLPPRLVTSMYIRKIKSAVKVNK